MVVKDGRSIIDVGWGPPFHNPCTCREGIGKGSHVRVEFNVVVCCSPKLQNFVSCSKDVSLDQNQRKYCEDHLRKQAALEL